MDVFVVVFSQIAAMLLLTAAGWCLGYFQLVTDAKPFSLVLTRVCLPAMIVSLFQTEYSTKLVRDLGLASVGTVLCCLLPMAAGLGLAVLLRRDRRSMGSWILCAGFSNCIFMGRPVAMALYGEDTQTLFAGITFAFNLLGFSLGALIFAWTARQGPAKISLRRVLVTPVMIAGFVGFALYFAPFRLPGPVNSALGSLGSMTTPLSMLILGMELANVKPRFIFANAMNWLLTLTRLVLAPVICWAALRLFIKDPVVLGVLVVSSAMPVASTVTVLSTEYGGDTPAITATTTLGNLLTIAVTPVLLSLLL